MSIDEIKELLELFNASGVGELEVERKDFRVRISRAPAVREAPPEWLQAPVQVITQPAASAGAVSSGGAGAAPARAPEADQVLVKSPIVGTYYESPAPGSASFVKVGDWVEPGQVLCIIESMKLMNEIEAEVAGILTAKLVESGKPVEYGEALFSIQRRPSSTS